VVFRRWMLGLALVLVTASALVVATTGSAAHQKAAAKFKFAVVTDIGGLNDKGFNSLAYQGLKNAQAKLDATGRVFISKSAADYVPNLSTAARQGNGIVIGIGFLQYQAIAQVAKRFPKVNFAIVDAPWVALPGKPKNVRGLIFPEQEAGYLVGVAAATVSTTGSISFGGGQSVPAVDAFLAGYRTGAKKTKPSIKFVSGYSEDFVDQAKCKELALNQIAGGSDVVFAAAGGCGVGALQAAKEKGVWGIGVDADQSYLGPHILTSATKHVETAVFDTVKLTEDGKFKGGTDTVFNAKNGGVVFGKVSAKAPNRAALIAKLTAVQKAIASGKIKNIPRK
jgi:basic membrane protein A